MTASHREGIVYYGSADGCLYAVQVHKVIPQWQSCVDEGISTAIALSGDRAYFGTFGGGLYALDLKERGRVLWRFAVEGAILSDPAVEGGSLYFGGADGRIHRLESATGRELWSFDAGSEIVAGPVLWQGRLFYGTTGGVVGALQ